MLQSTEIEMMSRNVREKNEEVRRLVAIVNSVYAKAEEGIWQAGTNRVTTEEMLQYIGDGELAVVRTKGKVIGCVRIVQIDEETGEFGLLAVDGLYQGYGLGNALISFAEEKCRGEGLQFMQIELLVPMEGTHPTKEILRNWYERLGYEPVATEPLDISYPRLAPLLALPCEFIIYKKMLV